MAVESSPPTFEKPVDPVALRRKLLWRIVPLIFFLYIVAYLDRANAGFAKLRMQEALNFSDDVFGWGFGIFFAGYLLLEIPGALLVEHWSARKWFTRILITWGFCSMGMALVRTPGEFYLARFLLGLAEAGFFPGVIVYFTHWFPRADRGRAMAGLVLGVPFSLALGSQVSALLLDVNWLGLAGWQWVFLAEGFPALILGIIVYFALNDRPRDARWLTAQEREWLEATLENERRDMVRGGGMTLAQAMRQPTVWMLALGILATNTGGYALLFWLPTAVKSFLAARHLNATNTMALSVTGLYYVFGLAGVWVAGVSSDRTGERKWHCAAGMACTGLFLGLFVEASLLPGLSSGWVFACLYCTGFFAFFWPPPFWVLPTLTLSESAAAVAIGFINICANIAGLIGSPLFGQMKAHDFTDSTCLLVLAGCFVLGGVFIALLRVEHAGAAQKHP